MQLDALVAAGVQNRDVFADVTSGSKTAIERPGMKKLLEYAEPGDTVVVWRVDRLGRSLIDVLNTVTLLRERGVQLRSISDGIDPAQGDEVQPCTWPDDRPTMTAASGFFPAVRRPSQCYARGCMPRSHWEAATHRSAPDRMNRSETIILASDSAFRKLIRSGRRK